MGNMLSLTDPVGNTTSWTYDALGDELTESELVSLGYMPGTTTLESPVTVNATSSFQYDLDGDLTESIDADANANNATGIGHVTTYAYNSTGQETCETWYSTVADAEAGTPNVGTVSYAYDLQGNMLSASNTVSPLTSGEGQGEGSLVAAYTYHYDSVGNVTDVTTELAGVTANGSTIPIQLASTYDYNGNRRSLAANIGGTAHFNTDGTFAGFNGSGINDFLNSYSYDSRGNMTGVTQQTAPGSYGNVVAPKNVVLGYDADSRVTSVNLFASNDAADPVAAASYGYNADSELTELTYSDALSNPLAGYHWDYNAAGLVSDMYSRNDTSGTPGSTCTAWASAAYNYDATGQLTATTYSANFAHAPTSNTSQTYDSNGNRTTSTGLPPGTESPQSAADRLLTDGTYDYTYDPDGNRIAQTTIVDSTVTGYTWDNHNDLTSVKQYACGAAYVLGICMSEVDYGYDAFGGMVSRTDVTAGTSENYVYDGQNLALVLNGSGQVTERELYGPAVDQVLATEAVPPGSAPQAAGTVSWYFTDNQGTVRDVAVYDSTAHTTTVVDHVIFDPFGKATQGAGFSAVPLPEFGFAGMRLDPATALYVTDYRFYDPGTGNWLSQDPLGFNAGDTNLSRYCGNSPTNYTAASGMVDWANDRGPLQPVQSPQKTVAYGQNEPFGPFTLNFIVKDGAFLLGHTTTIYNDLGETASAYVYEVNPTQEELAAIKAALAPRPTVFDKWWATSANQIRCILQYNGFTPAHSDAQVEAIRQKFNEGSMQGTGALLAAAVKDSSGDMLARWTAQGIGKAVGMMGRGFSGPKVPVRSGAGIRIPSAARELVTRAEQRYPKLAGKLQWHHTWPFEFGPPPPIYWRFWPREVQLPAAYHQVITNEIRAGLRALGPNPRQGQLWALLQNVYTKFPINGFPGLGAGQW